MKIVVACINLAKPENWFTPTLCEFQLQGQLRKQPLAFRGPTVCKLCCTYSHGLNYNSNVALSILMNSRLIRGAPPETVGFTQNSDYHLETNFLLELSS